MEVQEIIDKWKLNRALLASKMDMPKGTFNNKLSPKHPTKFSDKEMFQLKEIIFDLYKDIDTLEHDFNQALSLIANA